MVSFPSGWAGAPATRERIMAQVPGLSFRSGCPTGVTTVQRTPRELFHAPECPPSFLHLLVEGRVSVALLTSDGKSRVTGVLQPGDVFGNLSLCAAASHGDNGLAEAVTRSRALVLGSRDAKALVGSDPELALRIRSAVARRLRAASERLEELVYGPVEARVAAALCGTRATAVAPRRPGSATCFSLSFPVVPPWRAVLRLRQKGGECLR
jgi:CRP-like cAMP-binding protein